jgi:hypothetical protein
MTLIRIYVRSDGAELDVREEETVSLKSEPETARLARMMRRVLGKVERALDFDTPMVSVPADLLSKTQSVDLTALTIAPEPTAAQVPELPAPSGHRGSGAPWWRVENKLGLASISPTEPYNRRDPDTPTITIAIPPGEWKYPEARALALALLAATEWKEQDDDDA